MWQKARKVQGADFFQERLRLTGFAHLGSRATL